MRKNTLIFGEKNCPLSFRTILGILFLLPLFFSDCSKGPVCESLKPEQADTSGCKVGMDVAFLIDYTSSMGTIIENIKTSVNTIVANIAVKSQGDYQLSLGVFDEITKGSNPFYYNQPGYTSLPASSKMKITAGPATDQCFTVMEKFSLANNSTFATQLFKLNTAAMVIGDGVYLDEPGGLMAYEYVNNNFGGNWRSGKKKFCFIITDAPDGGINDQADATDDTNLQNLAAIANANSISFILITTLPGGSNYEVKLIDNNTGSYKLVNANIDSVASDINDIINTLCE